MSESPTLCPRPLPDDEVINQAVLRRLVDAYGHAVDRRDYALLRTLYHDDGIDDHSPYFVGAASDYIDWLPSMMANWSATSHVMLSTLFLIDGDQAEGIVNARAWHLTTDHKREFIAWGRYADRYERRDGAWRFAHRFFVLDSIEDRSVGAVDDFGSTGVAIGAAGADDPTYGRLHMFAADRAARET
ncbi:nuclear transport factor 2 family protein [Flavisphingomonas formosensis]|uniref:nuclear transport factor 2 family protein n=1 Tax=Flavisphingomonas formosensis TaxID=861534 RepID=UPI001E560565|nr:nuclear transport factor 2 family protein [Sphingomonas formosensis]